MIPSPFVAWVIGRQLSGQPLNGELTRVSPAFKSLVERLEAMPLETRQAGLACFLTGRPDREEIVSALANVDPLGPRPAPEADDEPDDGWGPIRFGTLPPAEPFPLDVLPTSARELAKAAADSIGCPVDFPAVAMLAAASGIIGRSASLLIKPGYFASASLYVALVGSPSSGKSPALHVALSPVWFIAQTLQGLWQAEWDAWKATDAENAKMNRSFGVSFPPTPRPRPLARSWRKTRGA